MQQGDQLFIDVMVNTVKVFGGDIEHCYQCGKPSGGAPGLNEASNAGHEWRFVTGQWIGKVNGKGIYTRCPDCHARGDA